MSGTMECPCCGAALKEMADYNIYNVEDNEDNNNTFEIVQCTKCGFAGSINDF